MNYPEQLRTDSWKSIRRNVLKERGYLCELCYNQSFKNNCIVLKATIEFSPNEFHLKYRFKEQEFNKSYFFSFPSRTFGGKEVSLFIQDESGIPMIKGIKVYSSAYSKLEEQKTIEIEKERKKIAIADPSLGNYFEAKVEQLERELEDLKYSERNQYFWYTGHHLHHRYYIEGREASEYPLDALQVLCVFCHKALHESESVSVLDESGNIIRNVGPWENISSIPDEYNDLLNPED